MIKVTTNDVVRDISEIKTGVSGVVRNVTSGFTGVSGTVRQFFGKLHGLDHFEIEINDILYKSTSDTSYTTMSKPTSYGETSYDSKGSISVYENGKMVVYANNASTFVLRTWLYGVFSNGRRVRINNLYKFSNSLITISGTASNEKTGTGSTSSSLQIVGTYGSFSAPWSVSTPPTTNPYSFYILASDLGGSATMKILQLL